MQAILHNSSSKIITNTRAHKLPEASLTTNQATQDKKLLELLYPTRELHKQVLKAQDYQSKCKSSRGNPTRTRDTIIFYLGFGLLRATYYVPIEASPWISGPPQAK